MQIDNTQSRTGVTLVETLVSLAIIGILVAILIPAIQAIREAARKTQCQNNIRQTAIALHSFHTAKGSLPSHYNEMSLAHPLTEWDLLHTHSWRAVLLPYIEQSGLHDSIDWEVLATDSENDSITTTVVPTYVCPSGQSPSSNLGAFLRHDGLSGHQGARSDYDGLAGIWDLFEVPPAGTRDGSIKYLRWSAWGSATFDDGSVDAGTVSGNMGRYNAGKFSEVTDGLSNTILLVERAGRPKHLVNGKPEVTEDNPNADYLGQVCWSASNNFSWRINFRDIGVNQDNSYGGLYSFHSRGASIAKADGSVGFLSDSTDMVTLRKMIGRSDGEH